MRKVITFIGIMMLFIGAGAVDSNALFGGAFGIAGALIMYFANKEVEIE